jgi:hypothetical protein
MIRDLQKHIAILEFLRRKFDGEPVTRFPRRLKAICYRACCERISASSENLALNEIGEPLDAAISTLTGLTEKSAASGI